MQIADNSSDANNRERSDETLTRRINYIQSNIAAETRCCVGRVSTAAIAGQREYRFPNDIVSPQRIAFYVFWSTPPAYERLDYKTIPGLDNDGTWERSPVGLPSEYYRRGEHFGLYPTPSLAYSTTYAIQIDYYKRPADLSELTDIPFDGHPFLVPYHKLLVLGVVYMCLREDGIAAADVYTEYEIIKKRMYDDLRYDEDYKANMTIGTGR